MAKVEIHGEGQLPTEKIISASKKSFDLTASDGRVIRLRRPGPLERLDFKKASGSDKLNLLYIAEVSHLEYVGAINGETVNTPATELQLRALYQRLDEINEEVQAAVAEHFLAIKPGEVVEAVKK